MKTTPLTVAVSCLLFLNAQSADWPMLGHDSRRSNVTSDSVALPLTTAWTHRAPRPHTAWPGPAKWDAYAKIKNLASMRNFDPSYAVTVVGKHLWYGSSADDAVHCLDPETGRELWVFTTDGPVRLPPTWYDGRLYAASDDGFVYCLEPDTGKLLWATSPKPRARRIMADGKLISTWPIRTGVLLQRKRAIFAASLLPWQPSYLCSVDAATGRTEGPGTYQIEFKATTMQGPLVASTDRLFISQGRQAPIVCELHTGKLIGTLGRSGDGGVWGLVSDAGLFVHGRGQNHGANGELRGFDGTSRESVATFPKAHRLAMTSTCVYLLGDGKVQAFDRKRYLQLQRDLARVNRQRQADEAALKKLPKDAEASQKTALKETIAKARKKQKTLVSSMQGCYRWNRDTECGHSLILAGGLVFAGGSGQVVAYAAEDGAERWRAPLEGTAHALAVAGGRLFVSTDSGAIHCFAGAVETKPKPQ